MIPLVACMQKNEEMVQNVHVMTGADQPSQPIKILEPRENKIEEVLLKNHEVQKLQSLLLKVMYSMLFWSENKTH